MGRYSDGMTVREAKEVLRTHAHDGDSCPVCHQFVKIYKRKITASQLRTAAAVYQEQLKLPADNCWVHLPSIPQRSRDFATLAYFGIAEQKPGKRDDGGAPGYWRITAFGVSFLRGVGSVQKYKLIYSGRCIGGDGDFLTVREIAPEFRLDELMAGV